MNIKKYIFRKKNLPQNYQKDFQKEFQKNLPNDRKTKNNIDIVKQDDIETDIYNVEDIELVMKSGYSIDKLFTDTLHTYFQEAREVGRDEAFKEMGMMRPDVYMIDPNESKYAINYSLKLSSQVGDNIRQRIKTILVEGSRHFTRYKDIAKQIREVFKEGVIVNVAPKVDANGNILREGYSYKIDAKRWSEIVARTETMRFANNGRLDTYKQSGVVKRVMLITGADDRVCPECLRLEGEYYRLDEAREVLPLHPNCRCTWVPIGTPKEKETVPLMIEEAKKQAFKFMLPAMDRVDCRRAFLNYVEQIREKGKVSYTKGILKARDTINQKIFDVIGKENKEIIEDFLTSYKRGDIPKFRAYLDFVGDWRTSPITGKDKILEMYAYKEARRLQEKGLKMAFGDIYEGQMMKATNKYKLAKDKLLEQYGEDRLKGVMEQYLTTYQKIMVEVAGNEPITAYRGVILESGDPVIGQVMMGNYITDESFVSLYSMKKDIAKEFLLKRPEGKVGFVVEAEIKPENLIFIDGFSPVPFSDDVEVVVFGGRIKYRPILYIDVGRNTITDFVEISEARRPFHIFDDETRIEYRKRLKKVLEDFKVGRVADYYYVETLPEEIAEMRKKVIAKMKEVEGIDNYNIGKELWKQWKTANYEETAVYLDMLETDRIPSEIRGNFVKKYIEKEVNSKPLPILKEKDFEAEYRKKYKEFREIYEYSLKSIKQAYEGKDIKKILKRHYELNKKILEELFDDERIKVYRGMRFFGRDKERIINILKGVDMLDDKEINAYSLDVLVSRDFARYSDNTFGIIVETEVSYKDICNFFLFEEDTPYFDESELLIFGGKRPYKVISVSPFNSVSLIDVTEEDIKNIIKELEEMK